MSEAINEKQETDLTPQREKTHLFSRQAPSTPAKIAFWAAVVGSLAGIGGVTALALTSGGHPSPDSVTLAAIWLVSLALLATRMRWVPVITTVLGGAILYLTVTEPYALASLADPKGPNGGFGKFVGILCITACALTLLGCSLSSVVQNYRSGSRRTPRWLSIGLGMVAGMVIGAALIGAMANPPVATGVTLTNGVPTVHMGETNFSVSSVNIAKGSKLVLVDDTKVTHNLFNGSWQNGAPTVAREAGAPTISNMQLSGNSVTVGPFATAGTYHILCTIHQGMNLTIVVQ